jgi:hypothetical protein
MAIFG